MSPPQPEPPAPDATQPAPARWRWGRRARWLAAAAVLLAMAAAVALIADEVKTSRRQAERLAAIGREVSFSLHDGASDALRFPGNGPYDERLGYHGLPGFIDKLQDSQWHITAQARMSPRMREAVDRGLHVPYREKTQAGLTLLDCRGELLYAARYPQEVYGRFDAVPPLVANALLFIENRDLLDATQPRRNPAVDWSRLARALVDQAVHWIVPSHANPGGSTLATQIEKYRHSDGGRTASIEDKLRQMASASLRAYLGGEDTLAWRQQLVADYLDTVPLAARAGFGEVHGLGDALAVWYGRDFDDVNRALRGSGPAAASGPSAAASSASPSAAVAGPAASAAAAGPAAALQRQALAYKQVLSLLIAQRRPTYYLGRAEGSADLAALTDAHLRLLAAAGLIPAALRDAALPLALSLAATAEIGSDSAGTPFNERKAVTALRASLREAIGVQSAYALDRLDVEGRSSVDGSTQRAGAALLRSLGTRDGARAAGLYGPFLLTEGDDLRRLVVSFTLYERGEQANRLRVQTDSLDQPLDINEGVRLDLGSTAKARTLVTYLELVAELHARWQPLDPAQLAAVAVDSRDVLGQWVRQALQDDAERSLPRLLDAALERRYSASPAEGFFTGGGLHRFDNFEAADNSRVVSVREATTRSVNLVYIRLMRDVVRHLMFGQPGAAAALTGADDDPARLALLARFADQEGRTYQTRFFAEQAGLAPDAVVARLLRGRAVTPARLAAVFGELQPSGDVAALRAFIAQQLPQAAPDEAELAQLHLRYAGGRMSLADRGYVASVHPLALWLAGHRQRHPQADLRDALAASTQQRQDVYAWLFKTRNRAGQDRRIRSLLEEDAFVEVHRRWQRLGYPFAALTPSYATALGASGDRPASLAELMGIIVNGGMRKPVARLESLVFAHATPFETRLAYQPRQAERVLSADVAAAVRGALIGVVEDGTARRLKGAFTLPDGTAVVVGGKTGTGDHRSETFDRSGRRTSMRVVSRSAALMFLIGERYYGTMMAFVGEPYAANYRFTSALPSQLLKAMAPALQPLLDEGGCR